MVSKKESAVTQIRGAYDWDSISEHAPSANDVSVRTNATKQDRQASIFNDNLERKPSEVCSKREADLTK